MTTTTLPGTTSSYVKPSHRKKTFCNKIIAIFLPSYCVSSVQFNAMLYNYDFNHTK